MISEHLFFQGVVPPQKLPTRPLAETAPRAEIAWCDETREFFRVLFAGAGLPMAHYRPSALQRRIPACLRFLGLPSMEAARLKLQARPDLALRAMNSILLGVTAFCRDRLVFQHLRETVIPGLRRVPAPLRVWSAACSDGRELYSIALLLADAGLLQGAHLLGTDCRPEAIALARQGAFAEDALEMLDVDCRANYFAPGTNARHIDPKVRRLVQWKLANLFAGTEPGPWNLILWRNMAIYLEPAPAAELWAEILAQLAPGGYLVTGKADYPPRDPLLERVGPCIYRKITR